MLRENNVVARILDIADKTMLSYESERTTRMGNMGFVVKLATLIKKRYEQENMKNECDAFLIFDSRWTDFVDGELLRSNEQNSKALGGRQRSDTDDNDDPSSQFDEKMEEIMNRFNIVNNMMQKNDDDDEEEVDKMGDDEPDQEDVSDTPTSADYNAITVKFDLST
jgi:hypothetical protein